MRRSLIRSDVLEAVIGLGAGLFYNSPMEACIVVCRTKKPASHRGRVLFVNALNEVAREKALSFLRPDHIRGIVTAYRDFADVDGFVAVASLDSIQGNDWSLSIPLYMRSEAREARRSENGAADLGAAIEAWERGATSTFSAGRALLDSIRESPS
jgi:type I restriction enzyme M protein